MVNPMRAYIARRLLLFIPTLFGIMLINFVIVQAAPGGPVEQMIAKLEGLDTDITARIGGDTGSEIQQPLMDQTSEYRGSRGLDPDLVREIETQYGFDKPPAERFFLMMYHYLTLDFGDSFYHDISVTALIAEKLPVSLSLGLWSTLLVYGLSIPLGIQKAVRHGSHFDVWSSTLVTICYAIPGFLLALLLIIVFAGGSYWQFFPLRGLISDNFDTLSLAGKVADYFWHLVLPLTAMVLGSFATLTFLTKNAFLDQIARQYVMTARAKGLNERQVLYGHIFRNAMLIVIAGFPAALISILFTNSLLIEVVFSLDGLGLLGFESAISRDYPVVFGTLYIFTLLGLVARLLGDLTYALVDPRIDFDTRDY